MIQKIKLVIGAVFIAFFVFSQEIEEKKVDQVVENTLKTFNVPGIAVGILHNGKTILSKGYGVSDIDTQEKVNAQTNFGIASNSKLFTAVALAILVDREEVAWDDKVKKYIPEFKMYNEYVTEEFTIRDLLVHRSGLGLGAGDLMVWPDGHDFTPTDIIENIHYLKPVSGFRTKYDYDNLLYIIAGEVIHRITDLTWAEFVQKELLTPLKMNRSAPNWKMLKDTTNSISPHVPIEGELKVIDRYTNTIFDAAAGIYSNVEDLEIWINFMLNNGKTESGEQLISQEQMNEIFSPQTLVPNSTKEPYHTLFKAYGLGVFLQDVNGKLEVSHTGGLEGIVTQIIMYPQLQLGIIVLTNQQSGAAFMSISNTIKDFYLNDEEIDWVKKYDKLVKANAEKADTITTQVWKKVETNAKSNQKQSLKELKKITGTYHDNWFGKVHIFQDKNQFRFESERSKQLQGDLYFVEKGVYAVKWDNAYLHADAFVYLKDKNKISDGFEMLPISPLTDFSYDFQDLDFKKLK